MRTDKQISVEETELPFAYTGFFGCFNHGEFFRAHELLEALWLQMRHEPIGDFYKGLIQLAGAFVHIEKQRYQPGLALLRLADANLAKYSGIFEKLDTTAVRHVIQEWRRVLEQKEFNPSSLPPPPQLRLVPTRAAQP